MALKRLSYTGPLRLLTQRVGVRGGHQAAPGVTRGVVASSADLGSSSKYSNANLEH